MDGEFVKMSPEQAAECDRIGYTTAYELFTQYGIPKLKTSRAVRSGRLNGFMNGFIDKYGQECRVQKWYILKDDKLTAFIEQNKTKLP